MEAHDLETYISANKREWIDTHSLLAGRAMKAEDCLPYLFQKLIDKKIWSAIDYSLTMQKPVEIYLQDLLIFQEF